MKFKQIVVGTALAIGLSGIALAQEKKEEKKEGGPRPEARERMQKTFEELGLNAEQKEKVQAAMREQGEKMKEMRDNQNLSQEERRTKFKEMQDAMTAKMKGILTPEQFTKWEKSRDNLRGKAPEGAKKRKSEEQK